MSFTAISVCSPSRITIVFGAEIRDKLSIVRFARNSWNMPTSALKIISIRKPKLPKIARMFSPESMKKQINTASTMKTKLKNVTMFSRSICATLFVLTFWSPLTFPLVTRSCTSSAVSPFSLSVVMISHSTNCVSFSLVVSIAVFLFSSIYSPKYCSCTLTCARA